MQVKNLHVSAYFSKGFDMSSIHTNASAMTALHTLSKINKDLSAAQGRISTGLAISEAKDGAAYWSIASTMRTDGSSQNIVSQSLKLGKSKIDTAYSAIELIQKGVEKVKDLVLSAKNKSADDRTKIQEQIATELDGIQKMAEASFNETALLRSNGSDKEFCITASYDRVDGNIVVGEIKVNLDKTRLVSAENTVGLLEKEMSKESGSNFLGVDVSKLDGSQGEVNGKIDGLLNGIDAIYKGVVTAASHLGAVKGRVDQQITLVDTMADAIARGVGALVDADMNRESSRLSALQVQQQLGVQALSIANASPNSILSLFRG